MTAEAPVPTPARDPSLNGYICYYNRNTVEVYAASVYEAKQEAVKHFNVPAKKQYQVSAFLAEKGGKPVEHVADF